MNWYDQAQVIVNGSGIMANSVSISSKNSVEGIKSLGVYGAVNQVPKGPLETNISCDYILEIGNEPNYNELQYLKTIPDTNSYSPLKVEICGVTGYCYMDRYGVRVRQNSPTTVSVSYRAFEELEGVPSTEVTGVFDQSEARNVSHSWSTFILPEASDDAIFSDFSYDAQLSWRPIYRLGSRYPSQVQLGGIKETMAITRNLYKPITFSGESSERYYAFTSGIQLNGLEAIYGNSTDNITFAITGVPVVNSEYSLSSPNYSAVTSRIEKYYQ